MAGFIGPGKKWVNRPINPTMGALPVVVVFTYFSYTFKKKVTWKNICQYVEYQGLALKRTKPRSFSKTRYFFKGRSPPFKWRTPPQEEMSGLENSAVSFVSDTYIVLWSVTWNRARAFGGVTLTQEKNQHELEGGGACAVWGWGEVVCFFLCLCTGV